MGEWNTTNKLPENNRNVIIMLDDASGMNAKFLNNKFYNGNEIIENDRIVYWKYSDGAQTFEEQISKKCLMCGRKRLYG